MSERIICLKCGREGHHSASCKRPEPIYESKFHGVAEDRVQDALMLILAHPEGITAVQLAIMTGWGVDSTLDKLRRLRHRGEISPSLKGGSKALWMTTECATAAGLVHAELKRKEAAEQQVARNVRKRALEAIAKADAEDEFYQPVVKRTVNALEAAPLRVRAPRWIFEAASV